MIEQIKTSKRIVETVLRASIEARDSDDLLILKVWAHQDPELRTPTFRFWDFAERFKRGRYLTPESITRARRKLQEQDPELRGTNWIDRHEKEKIVRHEIREI